MRRLWVLLLLLAVAGCAGHGNASDDQPQGGFYGGVSGGLTR
jgi:hypothetical protein